jgi:serine protease AprX
MRWNVWLRGVTAALLVFVATIVQAATIGSTLSARVAASADATSMGVVIVAFKSRPIDMPHLAVLRGAGVTRGFILRELGMVAAPVTAAQVRALAGADAVRSIWANDALYYFNDQSRTLAGVDRLRTDAGLTKLNGGLPVSGRGDFSVVINDSGIDGTHEDLKLGENVIQNVQILTDTATLTDFTPLLVVENVPDTDSHVGHGTHCAGIVGGTGERSGGRYAGVAPGAKLIGLGSGAGLFILNALGGFEWSLANQFQVQAPIRIISNSWGSSGAFDPNDPINIASRLAHDRNIAVVFAAGNAGPGPDTLNPYAKAPWVIGVAAGTKEGGLAGFSSRGTPKDRRLSNSDPNDDYDAPTLTAPGTGREFETNAAKFTAAIVSTRAVSNVVANGATDDTEIPPAYVPFYTQISGTSMATPFVAGVAALMLDANPLLTPDEIKQILVSTASRMPGYEEYEVGAGCINAYAAVDSVFKRSKPYGTFVTPAFNYRIDTAWGPAQSFTVNYTPQAPGPDSTNTFRFTVDPGIGIVDVRIDYGNNAATEQTGNSLGLMLYAPDGTTYSAGISLPILNAPRREVIVRNPQPGQWVAEVRALRGIVLAAGASPTSPVGLGVPERVDGTIFRATLTAAPVGDIAGHPAEAQIRNALLTRQMDVQADGLFHPEWAVSRAEFAEHLTFNTAVRQSLADTPRFSDVTGRMAAIAEAVTANGSTLRDWNFAPAGMMSSAPGAFNPWALVTRLDLAVALVRALGLDDQAKAAAGTVVTASYNGQAIPLADLDQIPLELRGYVQLALDKQILQAFFTLEQGPFDFQPTLKARVKPQDTTTRAFLAFAFDSYRRHFAAGN